MNRIRHLIRLCALTAMLFALASLFTSCLWVMEKDTVDSPSLPIEEEDSFQLRFQICTRTINSSRADDKAEEEEGSVAENIINLNDINYYIFDKDQNFLLDLTPDIDTERSFAISSDYSLYEVVAKIDASKTDYFKRSSTGTVDFYLLALANFSEKSGYEEVQFPELGLQNNLTYMFTSPATPVIMSLPNTEKLMKAATNDASRNYFPMAGLQYFSISWTWFETPFGEAPVDLTALTGKKLDMLRSVAKIEVIDRINLKPDEIFDEETDAGEIRIESVCINGVMKNARVLPTLNQWKGNPVFETRQVTEPSIPDSYIYLSPPPLNDNGSILPDNIETGDPYRLPFVYDAVETQKRVDHCPVYSCYVWEYSHKEEIPTAQLPYLSVKVKNPKEVSSDATLPDVETPESTTYNVFLKSDMTPSAKEPYHIISLLRNHIYRYEISGAGTSMTIKWSVCPMDKASTDITFN